LSYHCHVILSAAKNLKICSGEALASLGNQLVMMLPFYGSLSTKRHPRPTTRINTDSAINISQQFPNANTPAITITSPKPKTICPNLCVCFCLSLIQLMPLNIMLNPMPQIAITGAVPCSQFISSTSFASNHSILLEGVEGEFKRGYAPLRALSILSLDGRGSG